MNKVLVATVSFFITAPVYANPIAKLCRGSTVIAKDYEEFQKIQSGANTLICFHVGRMLGQIEENMTFKEKARGNLPAELLNMADEMVDRAGSLRSFCGGDRSDGNYEKGVRKNDRKELKRQLAIILGADGLNARLNDKTCSR